MDCSDRSAGERSLLLFLFLFSRLLLLSFSFLLADSFSLSFRWWLRPLRLPFLTGLGDRLLSVSDEVLVL